MYCIYNYIIINKQTTLIIITILLIINITLKCWSHAYRTSLRYKRGGELLKIEPKVPTVQSKCLATCNDIKETHVHIPSGVEYFTCTVTSLLLSPSNILYRARYKTGLELDSSVQWRCWSPDPQCGSFFKNSVQHFPDLLLLLSILYNPSCFLLFPSLLASLCSFLVFSAFVFALSVSFFHTFSLSFLHAALVVVPLPHRVLSLSFFKWLKCPEEKQR